MGQTAAETVREIEQTRQRLGEELKQLEDRMPSPARLARRGVGLLAGGGIGGAIAWMVVRKMRARATVEPEVTIPMQAVVNLLPDDVARRIEAALAETDMRSLAIGLGAAMVLLRLMELRRLRSLTRALLSAR